MVATADHEAIASARFAKYESAWNLDLQNLRSVHAAGTSHALVVLDVGLQSMAPETCRFL